jgi:hypothetical protein
MTEGRDGETAGQGGQHDDERPLILDELGDRLEQFRLLGGDQAETDRILGELGGSGPVEHEIVMELAARQPIAHPERLQEAHFLAMRALEVLARNGSRPPSQLSAGPFTPVARFAVQQVIRFIVRTHQANVVDAVRNLYTRRVAWVPPGDPARLVLVRARLDVEAATTSYKTRTGGLPTFLVGGAAVSSLAQGARGAASAAAGSHAGVVVAFIATFVLLAVASWIVLRGAAVARRRIRLTLDRPLRALWETVGWCGHPPTDPARTFAAVAIVLTVVGWLLIPLLVLLVFTVF